MQNCTTINTHTHALVYKELILGRRTSLKRMMRVKTAVPPPALPYGGNGFCFTVRQRGGGIEGLLSCWAHQPGKSRDSQHSAPPSPRPPCLWGVHPMLFLLPGHVPALLLPNPAWKKKKRGPDQSRFGDCAQDSALHLSFHPHILPDSSQCRWVGRQR